MKYFSVSFLQDEKNLPKQKFPINLNTLQNPAMIMRILVTVVFTVVMWTTGDAAVAVFMFISFLIIPFVADGVYHSSYVKSVFKGKLMKRPVTVDFYADHLVFNMEQDENYKGIYERHCGFDKLNNIFDFPGVFVFSFKGEGGITIPKKVMTDEQILMVYNLVDNLFKNKYIKMK